MNKKLLKILLFSVLVSFKYKEEALFDDIDFNGIKKLRLLLKKWKRKKGLKLSTT